MSVRIKYKFKFKNIHYPEQNSQSFAENRTVTHLPNNVAYVDTIVHIKRKFFLWMRNWGPNYLGKQCNKERL